MTFSPNLCEVGIYNPHSLSPKAEIQEYCFPAPTPPSGRITIEGRVRSSGRWGTKCVSQVQLLRSTCHVPGFMVLHDCASQGGRYLLTESKAFRAWPAYFAGVKSEGCSSRASIRIWVPLLGAASIEPHFIPWSCVFILLKEHEVNGTKSFRCIFLSHHGS